MVTYISLYGLCIGIEMDTSSNRKKGCLIYRFMNRKDFLQGVYVLKDFKELSESFLFSISECVKCF